jgi:hypothetical protein
VGGNLNRICQNYVENAVASAWNKMNKMKRKYPNEDTRKHGQPTEKYKEERGKVKKS